MSVRERLRVEEASGHTLGCNGITCNMLVNNRCSVYSVRPMLCRLYGLVEGFECEHGCVPEGGLLSPEKGAEYLRRAVEIGGPITHSDPEMVRALEQLRDMLGGGSHGGFQEVVDQAMARLQSRHD
jgi:Fe-S-cluster containining protein